MRLFCIPCPSLFPPAGRGGWELWAGGQARVNLADQITLCGVGMTVVQIWYPLPVIVLQLLDQVTPLCLQVGGHSAVPLTLGLALWFSVASGMYQKPTGRELRCSCMCYLASLPCHLPWVDHVPASQVVAGPRLRDVGSILALTCSFLRSQPVLLNTSEQEISLVVVYHHISFPFVGSHNIVAETWPVQQPGWLMYPLVIQKTDGAEWSTVWENESVSSRVTSLALGLTKAEFQWSTLLNHASVGYCGMICFFTKQSFIASIFWWTKAIYVIRCNFKV